MEKERKIARKRKGKWEMWIKEIEKTKGEELKVMWKRKGRESMENSKESQRKREI